MKDSDIIRIFSDPVKNEEASRIAEELTRKGLAEAEIKIAKMNRRLTPTETKEKI